MNWFRFGNPDLLFFLWVVLPIVVLFLIYGLHMKRIAMMLFQANYNVIHLKRMIFQGVLLMLSFLCVAFAIASPQWGKKPETVNESLDIMLAMDISTSMLATDGNSFRRLTRVKNSVFSLLNQLEGDRIGLLYFAEASVVVCSLTRDVGTLRGYLTALTPDTLVHRGTNIGNAIEAATERLMLEKNELTLINPKSIGQKVLILFTDGEDFGVNTFAAAETATRKGIYIYCVGVGSSEQAVPIPLVAEKAGYKRDLQGKIVLTALDEKGLRDIASAGNGKYYHASDGIAQLTKDLKKLEKQKYRIRDDGQLLERSHWFVGIALLLLIGEMFIEIMLKERI